MLTIPPDKRSARGRAMLAREAGVPGWGVRLAGHVLAAGVVRPGAAVAGFWPMAGEIDIRPLLLALLGRGHAVLLPETPPLGEPLVFRAWRPGQRMVRERFGTLRPEGAAGVPDVVLVPLLAFDRRGGRLGYGGGYYDRTLARLPEAVRLGCAFAAQQVDAVPVLDHDVALHAVATERGVLRAER